MASCENKYTTLLDLSRQAKVISGETACFNGKIEVGIPFSGYPTGVDTGSTVSLGVVSSETAVFSGNTGTTIFDVSNSGSTNYDVIFSGYSGTVWTNALFSGNTSGLTLPITTLSASTQIVGPFWTLTQTGMTGDYVIGTEYTGYSLTYSFNQVEQLSVTAYTAYSGFSSASQENFSAGTLDYKGPLDYLSSVEDVTVDGRLTTNKITITNGASASTIGFVLTQLDETGKAGWVYNSSTASTNTFVSGGTLDGSYLNLSYNTGGSVPSIQLSGLTGGGTFTGNTSGDCITDIHVSKIHSCSPLNINPLDEGNVYFGSTSGVTIDIINSRIGIGRTPDYPLDMTIGSSRLFTSSEVSGNAVRFSGNTTGLTQFLIYDSDGAGISFGQRNSSDSFYTGYGEQGDGFLYSSEDQNGLNIISQPGTGTDDYIRFFAGQGAGAGGIPDLYIHGTGSTKGYVAIGHSEPTEKLDVAGNININTNGTNILISSYKGANSDGVNSFIGGGGQSSLGEVGATYKGSYNTAHGVNSLSSNTTGYYNSAQGYASLYSNTTGFNNSAHGMNALGSNTTGYQNSAHGMNALGSNTTGYLNSAIGAYALLNNTTGYSNSAIGMNALLSNTTGTQNSAHGVYALLSNTTGNYNSAIGVSALLNNTTGYSNSAIGVSALYSNTTGFLNSAIGVSALYSNTTGANNSAIGVSALRNNTTGESNSAIGAYALYSNTTGYSNSAIGMNALLSNTTGTLNSAHGENALLSNTTGTLNSAHGENALLSNTTGNYNSAIGVSAGRSITTGNNNTFVGYNAGYHASQLISAVNSMALGNGAYTTASNQVVIGNMSITQTLLNGNVGMGTETPTEKLHVLGNIKMVDGNQSNGYVLTSDSNGVGSWGYNTLTNRRVVYATASFDPSIVDYDIVIYSGGSGGGTIYLATGNVAGNEIILIRKGDTVAADLGAGGGGLINGSGTKALPTALYSTVRCIFDGTNWSCTNETLL